MSPSHKIDVDPGRLGREAAAVEEFVDLLAVEPDGQRVVGADGQLGLASGVGVDLGVAEGEHGVVVRVDLAEIDLSLRIDGLRQLPGRRLAFHARDGGVEVDRPFRVTGGSRAWRTGRARATGRSVADR